MSSKKAHVYIVLDDELAAKIVPGAGGTIVFKTPVTKIKGVYFKRDRADAHANRYEDAWVMEFSIRDSQVLDLGFAKEWYSEK